MSTDPYHAVQQEIQSSLQSASTLRASYVRIRSTAREGSEELEWARNEVCVPCFLQYVAVVLTAVHCRYVCVAESYACGIGGGSRRFGGERKVSVYWTAWVAWRLC